MTSEPLPLLPLSNAVPSFEFGKRKRWADLVITELVDVLLLVLSSQGKILYCGNGLGNLLGWKTNDLIDYEFADLLNADDKDGFKQAFKLSLRTGNPMPSSYVRIRGSPSTLSNPPVSEELMFEVNGRPQMSEAEDNAAEPIQVFFAVAKPHPNKTVAMLDTFLDLQEENVRLQNRVAELRARAPRVTSASPASSSSSNAVSMFATTSMVPKSSSQTPHPYGINPGDEVDLHSPLLARATGHLEAAGPMASGSGKSGPDDEDESGKKKKGPKKGPATTEQHVCVTCGRTESPEWRKGPEGPKTLCNACGLRWAKQSKGQKLPEEGAIY